jgi:hypothetical protein
METELLFLERTVNNKIKEYDEIYKNSDIFIIEKKEKLQEINIYLNIILQLELWKQQLKYNKKLLKKQWKTI